MLDSYFLDSNRLGFREWSQDDLPLARTLWGNAAVTKFIGGPFSERQIEDRLNKEIETCKNCGVQYWPISLLETGSYVGCAGLRPYAGSPGVFELGIHLRPEFWGRGLAEEAGQALTSLAKVGLREVWLLRRSLPRYAVHRNHMSV